MRKLELSIPSNKLVDYLENQIINFFPDGCKVSKNTLNACNTISLDKIRICFNLINLKYYSKGSSSYFNHLNGDHYASYLYFMSHYAYLEGDETLASKLFLLNKVMFGLDLFFKVELPPHFLLVHPVGSVIGNAKFGDFLVIYQGVTIGSTTDGLYPKFSNSSILYSNSSVIGDCNTGENFVLASNSSIINQTLESNKVIVGNYPNNRVFDNKNNLISKYFTK